MRSFDGEGEDVFFDTYDNIRTSIDSTSPESSVVEIQGSVFEKFEYGVWTRELMSISERRHRFLQGMGLDEFMSPQCTFSRESEGDASNRLAEKTGLDRVTESSGAVLDPLLYPENDRSRESEFCIKDLDSGKRFIVQDTEHDGLFSMLKEVGSDRLITLQEFEALFGLSCSAQRLMSRAVTPSREEHNKSLDGQKQKHRSWLRTFTEISHRMGMCKSDASVKTPKLLRTRTRIQQHCKRCLEFTALYTGQEIHAHKGSIRAMRFSPSGWYLASGGEDCIIRIWQVGDVEASCKCYCMNNSSRFIDKSKDYQRLGGKGANSTSLVIPEKVFKIRETPVQELCGHTSDILDLSWSNADCLLTSSKDKTVRMWKVGCSGCLKVFQHNDYVPCIQFNPVDDKYFISGSIDGKVRIWGVSENRVVDWADIRDIVTAVCYRPDGKGFVVGSITGSCRFYNYLDNTIQLGTQFYVQGKKKSAGKWITGLQFCPEDSERIMVSSAGSKIQIFDGVDVVHKFRGLRKTKRHLSTSFSSDGRYIVSVSDDSHVYIWNYTIPGSSSSPKRVKSVRPTEQIFSKGVTVALPWPGLSSLHRRDPSSTWNILDPSTWLKESESCYLGALLLVDGLSRISATWPEEKLFQADDRCSSCTRSLVIVTASSDGAIRSFNN